MRRVLHLKMVTQCAMLEDFGMFLVLADKASLLSYHGTAENIEDARVGPIRLSYRSTCSIVATKRAYITDSSTSQWYAGRPLLQRR